MVVSPSSNPPANDGSSIGTSPTSTSPAVAASTAAAAATILPGSTIVVPSTSFDDDKTAIGDKEANKSGASSPNKTKKEDTTTIAAEANPDMAWLTEKQKQIVLAQIEMPDNGPANFFQLFRFHTKFELGLNLVGLLFAIVAGKHRSLPRGHRAASRSPEPVSAMTSGSS